MRAYSLYAAAVAIFLPISFGSPVVGRSNGTMVYRFSELTASSELVWTPCYDNLYAAGSLKTHLQRANIASTCALLQVPLDYSEPSVGTLNLAIVKKPGSTEDAQEVLVNPGGPGGSSVGMVLGDYVAIQDKIGAEYSLVGIDPRGTKNSGPSSDCFPSYSDVARNAFLADVFTPADITSDYTLRKNHQFTLEYGKWCSQIYSVNGTAKYASTVATAQDMLHYIELRASSKGQPPHEAKLWYYGISYGSILGPTFASLYPDRIGRMIVDGVLDLEDHYNGGWEQSIVDSDKAARFFFKRCFEAGPKLCSFHQNATSWEELEQRYWDLLNALKESPTGLGDPLSNTSIALAAQGTILTPFVLTWGDIVNAMFTASYVLSPTLVVNMDFILVALQTANTELLSVTSAKAVISGTSYDYRMARTLVACLDANGRSNYTRYEDYKAFVNNMSNSSIYAGLNAAFLSGPICSKFEVHPPRNQTFDGIPRINGTSTPILFISGIADPITPLRSARKMQARFPGSSLLVWNSSGHSAHLQKSECVAKYEKQYMRDGTLPPMNTTCEVDQPNAWIALAKELNITQT